jgi:HK97 family phage prohead protease
MKTKHWTAPVVKAVTMEDEPGTFEALVSVFENVDHDGEVVARGAFTESLAKGLPAICWSHDWAQPPVGVALDAAETDEGLVIKGRLFVGEDEYSPLARQVYTAMKAIGGDGRPALRAWSFGANVKSERYEERDGRKVVVLEALDLIEASPCIRGVNERTGTLAVKAEQIRRAIDTGRLSEDELRKALADTKTVADPGDTQDSSPRGGYTPEQRRQIAALLFT